MTLEYNSWHENDENKKSSDYEETKLEKIHHVLEDAFYSELGMKTFRFVMSWMVFGILGIFVLVIPLYVLDNFVPSIPMDIKENEYFIIGIVASYAFTILHVTIFSGSNSWIVKNLNQIPKLNKRMSKVEDTLEVDQILKKAYDMENLLMYAKIFNSTIKREDPEAYEIMMNDIKNSKTEHEISIKKVGIDAKQEMTKMNKEIKKIKKKIGLSSYFDELEDE